MYTTTGEEIKKECFDKKLFSAARADSDYHIYRKYCVDRHVDKHKHGYAAAFIQQ